MIHERPFGQRMRRFLGSDAFRAHPVRTLWRRSRWALHWRLRPSAPFEFRFLGGLTLELIRTSGSAGVYLNGGLSDERLARRFRAVLEPGMTAIDCGAHVGEYSLLFASAVGPGGMVHAFEPHPAAFRALRSNLERNDVTNVRLSNAALSDRDGSGALDCSPDPTGSSLVHGAPSADDVPVEVVRLDSYASRAGITHVDVLKIDVEGEEGRVLAGARELILGSRPTLVFVECHTSALEREVVAFLQGAGYDTEVERHLHSHVVATRSSG